MATAAAPAETQSPEAPKADPRQLSGVRLIIAGILLGLINFIVVLDTTIANVSVPHISGSLGVSMSEGTWVITSYAVAEAICVPLTGWLAMRFGAVRVLLGALFAFGLFSALCGLAPSLSALVAFRIGQGLAGGPLMPITQTLLMRVFPPEKRAQAMAIWAVTTITAPIIGPNLGGWISDNWSWHWIFFINVPIIALCLSALYVMTRGVPPQVRKVPIDKVGLALLILWVGALQLMLDLGRDEDWFSSSFIIGCAVVGAIGFVAFVIWELTEAEPIVDLRVFRHRGYTMGVLSLMAIYGTFFATMVIIPQWLQSSLGYTATQAGQVMAFNGMLAIVFAPIVPQLMKKIDARLLVSFGVVWMAATGLMRTQWTTGSTFWEFAIPQLLQGMAMPFFFIPITMICLNAVNESETASAAGLMSFGRTVAGAMATAIATTVWSNLARADQVALVEGLNPEAMQQSTAQAGGLNAEQAAVLLEQLVGQQALAVATNQVFAIAALVLVVALVLLWFTPKPTRQIDPAMAH